MIMNIDNNLSLLEMSINYENSVVLRRGKSRTINYLNL